MELRPYQNKVIREIYAAWESGHKNVIAQLATGAGKTVIFTHILASSQEWSVAIAHRTELVSQISRTLGAYGIRHNIIAPQTAIREIIALHMSEFGRSFYDPQARCVAAGVDTLVRMDPATPWFQRIKIVVQDEGHHPQADNKWGKVAALFPNARGLYPTATPVRSDGRGLGKPDGIIDTIVQGPPMRGLIESGYLSKYRIFAPPSDLDLSTVTISASGDYSPPKLRSAVHKSHITGDVVSHYLRIAEGKLGVTFAVDIAAATEIAAEFRSKKVPAEVISSHTPALLRAQIMRRFRNREVLQLVNVDLLGEGVDVPAIEVVTMARPTQSFIVYCQQFGRALRPMPNKPHAIIIDHVGNVVRHGLPDAWRQWSLERKDRRGRSGPTDVIPLRTCLNELCLAVYERIHKCCPFCGFYSPPAVRSAPEFVDGDLLELNEEVLAKLRGDINRIDGTIHPPQHLDYIAQRAVTNRHIERQSAQETLRSSIALWAGYHKGLGREDSEIYRRFYFDFGIDVANAQVLGATLAAELTNKINFKLPIDTTVNSD